MTSAYTFRSGKRLILVTIIVSCLFLFAFQQGSLQSYPSSSYSHSTCHNTRSLNSQTTWQSSHNSISSLTSFLSTNRQYEQKAPYYLDLNDLNATSRALERQERILVLTPLLKKNSVHHLATYFDLLDKTTYPNHLISIGLLVSRSSDDDADEDIELLSTLSELVYQYQSRWFNKFHDITVYQRDFHLKSNIFFTQQQKQQKKKQKQSSKNQHEEKEEEIEEEESIPYQLQPYYRSVVARARNFLLTAALKDDHSWVTWMDVDVKEFPSTIFEDLTKHDVDVIVPNCLLKREDGAFWAYDRNNWQETDHSIRFQHSVGQDFVMLEGFQELATGRTLLVDMPTHLGNDYLVALDGVGSSFTLVKAQVHREGANFPSFPYQHQVDTEGFARMVQAMGFRIYGIPSYFIYHA
ncbi:Anp1-domain-containing protein [Cunninghamella echinulata]|nr:Anp1-domain-containing protein [Cunninghamella echinulata]